MYSVSKKLKDKSMNGPMCVIDRVVIVISIGKMEGEENTCTLNKIVWFLNFVSGSVKIHKPLWDGKTCSSPTLGLR